VNGADPLAVWKAVSDAAARARAGDGPTFVEAVAYRLQGHYFGDGMEYVDADELAAARAATIVPGSGPAAWMRRHPLGAFFALTYFVAPENPRARDAEAALLCMAMGMQNSLVTRLSGAVVRTTHLTGIITDLGIESARWFRFVRGKLAERTGIRLTLAQNPPVKPHGPKSALLGTVLISFLGGGAAGALLTVRFRERALLLPVAALIAGSVYAARTGRVLVTKESRK
jgi:uncharacterized membrane protein YoaK (UPF0700 family)